MFAIELENKRKTFKKSRGIENSLLLFFKQLRNVLPHFNFLPIEKKNVSYA